MFELDYWERVGLVLLAAGLVLLTAVIMVCKLSPRCWLHKHCPLRARYDEEKEPMTSSIYTSYTPIPSHGMHMKQTHPQLWSPQIASVDDLNMANKGEYNLTPVKKQLYSSSSEIEYTQATSPQPMSPVTPTAPPMPPPPPAGRGKLQFTMVFNQSANRINLNIEKASGLPRRMVSGSYDVCIKVQLIGSIGRQLRRKGHLTREQIINNTIAEAQTKLQRRLADIKFAESIEINISKEQVRNHALRLALCEYDKYSRVEVTGQILLFLAEQDLTQEVSLCEQFKEPPMDPKGELLISFSHLPTAEKLSVVIMKLKDIKAPAAATEVIGSYVKTTFIHRSRSLIRKKTSVRPFEKHQTVNETLVYDIKGKQLKHVCLIAAVMCTVKVDMDESCDSDSSTLTPNDVEVGRVIFGFDATGDGHAHWLETVQSPRTAIARWHKLS